MIHWQLIPSILQSLVRIGWKDINMVINVLEVVQLTRDMRITWQMLRLFPALYPHIGPTLV